MENGKMGGGGREEDGERINPKFTNKSLRKITGNGEVIFLKKKNVDETEGHKSFH